MSFVITGYITAKGTIEDHVQQPGTVKVVGVYGCLLTDYGERGLNSRYQDFLGRQ